MSTNEGSFTLFTGSMGGGKSLGGSSLAMDEYIVRGFTVVTNVELYADKIAEWLRREYGKIYDPDRIKFLKAASIRDFQDQAVRGGPGCKVLMLLDEAALDLSSKDHRTLNDETFNFVILCRKLYIDLVLIAQDANDVDKRIRQKAQREIHCRSLKNVFEWMNIPIFVQVPYVLSVGKKPWRRRVQWKWKGTAWGYFNSHTLHGSKAEAFALLEVAKAGGLARIKYPIWPYALAASITLCLSSWITCLSFNPPVTPSGGAESSKSP